MPSRLNINDAHSMAKHYVGKCLSKIYFNTSSLLKWMCKNGHTWDSSYSIVQQGGWCTQCLKNDEYLEKTNAIAEKKGGKCLSPSYINNLSKLLFKCGRDHIFNMTSHSLMAGSWCRKCTLINRREKEFEQIKKTAIKKGGRCLSLKYENKSSNLKWECTKGHKWSMQSTSIRKGLWCKLCRRDEICKKELDKLKAIAKKRGGQCLSEIYFRKDSHLKWKCKKGHTWSTMPAGIKKGAWCPICGHLEGHEKTRIYTIPLLKEYAKKRGGKMLSKSYKNILTPLKWECDKGHTWLAVPYTVIDRNSWCLKCLMDSKKLKLPDLQKIAVKRGGELLTKKYIDSHAPMKWKCAKGHIWLAAATRVKQGGWCMRCHYDRMSLPGHNPKHKNFKPKAKKLSA